MRLQLHVYLLSSLLLSLQTAWSQPLCGGPSVAFHLLDEDGRTIEYSHPEFNEYAIKIKMGTNQNNSETDIFGEFDTTVIVSGRDEMYPYANKNFVGTTWMDEITCSLEFLELHVRKGEDSMCIQITGQIADHLYIDSIPFRPGYKFYKTVSDGYQDYQQYGKLTYKHNRFVAVFDTLDFQTVRPIEYYAPFIGHFLKTNDELYLYLKIHRLKFMGKWNDYIRYDVTQSGKEITVNLHELTIGKNGAFWFPQTEHRQIGVSIPIGSLSPGKYTLIFVVGERKEALKFVVNSTGATIKTDADSELFQSADTIYSIGK